MVFKRSGDPRHAVHTLRTWNIYMCKLIPLHTVQEHAQCWGESLHAQGEKQETCLGVWVFGIMCIFQRWPRLHCQCGSERVDHAIRCDTFPRNAWPSSSCRRQEPRRESREHGWPSSNIFHKLGLQTSLESRVVARLGETLDRLAHPRGISLHQRGHGCTWHYCRWTSVVLQRGVSLLYQLGFPEGEVFLSSHVFRNSLR